MIQLQGLRWGFKASFRTYVERMAGSIDVSSPAVGTEGNYFFPFVGRDVDAEHGATLVRFAGAVAFRGHGGLLSLTIAFPTLVFHGPATTLSIADPRDPSTLLPLADLAAPETEGPIPAALTAQGSALLRGTYPAGTELDPLTLLLPGR
jgi:hypothetical protein